jgi:hypothetical protein
MTSAAPVAPKDIGKKIAYANSSASLAPFDSRVTSISGIRIFDVGQGDCIGLLDQKRNVFCYVDYGGFIDHPDLANPGNTKTRLSVAFGKSNVTILLTHWDKDHFYSGYQMNPGADACKWIVPRQWASPTAARFAARLYNAFCWPESAQQIAYSFAAGKNHFLEIRKCRTFRSGAKRQDRNTSGLAVTLVKKRRGGSNPQLMLLPGDCHFNGIPNVRRLPIRALVAYHHGSKTGWNRATSAAISRRSRKIDMVYSYSPKNTFKHPVRGKYRPTWDRVAHTTPALRKRGKPYQDIYW